MRTAGLRAMALAVTVAAAPRFAGAAERPYAFVQTAATLPETTLELESWVGAQRPRAGPPAWDWWLGPVVGLTDHVEAGLFAIFTQPPAPPGGADALALSALRLQLAWALADRGAWPVDVQLRLEVAQGIGAAHSSAWLWAIASRELGGLQLAANLSGWLEFEDPVGRYLEARVGASLEIARGLRLGAEVNGSAELGEVATLFAGPALALGRGRVWASAGLGLGLGPRGPRNQGRLVLGVAL